MEDPEETFARLEVTTPAKEYLAAQSWLGAKGTLARKTIDYIEKHLGLELLVKLSPTLYETKKISQLSALRVAQKLTETGLLQEIHQDQGWDDEPFLFHYQVISRKDTDKKTSLGNGYGTDFFSPDNALWKALGEMAERTLWFSPSPPIFRKSIITSYAQLQGKAVDIFSLAGFSQEQIATHSQLQFDEHTQFEWIPATSLQNGRKKFVPIQLVSASKHYKVATEPSSEKEPMLRWCVTTGLATAPTIAEAALKGFLEIIERDAFIISYLNKLSPPRVDLEAAAREDEDIRYIVTALSRYNLEAHVVMLPTDFPVSVFAAVVHDPTGIGPRITVGARASFSPKVALVDAIAEALSGRQPLRLPTAKKENDEAHDRDWRTWYWGTQPDTSKISFLIRGEKQKIDLTVKEKNKKIIQERLETIKKTCLELDYDCLYIDLTTPEVRKAGFYCVSTLIPQLQPLHLDESIPYQGGERLQSVPKKFGYSPALELNREPHPFP